MSNCPILKASANGGGYSKEEQIIGTWIDGKPIYRKVLTLTTQGAGQETNFPVFSIDQMIKMQCVVKQAIGNYVSVPYWASSSDYAQLWYRASESKLVAKCSEKNWVYTLIVEYTKPTGGGVIRQLIKTLGGYWYE